MLSFLSTHVPTHQTKTTMSLHTDVGAAASVAVAVLAGAAAGWAGARVADRAVSCVEKGVVCVVCVWGLSTRARGQRRVAAHAVRSRRRLFHANARLASPSLALVVEPIAS